MSWVGAAGILGALSVVAGAFGAHGLEARVEAAQLDAWRTASQYGLMHSAVLLALALYGRSSDAAIALPATLFCVGIVLFSGSIFGLVLGGPRLLGPVTPLGGLALIGGWIAVAVSLWRA